MYRYILYIDVILMNTDDHICTIEIICSEENLTFHLKNET